VPESPENPNLKKNRSRSSSERHPRLKHVKTSPTKKTRLSDEKSPALKDKAKILIDFNHQSPRNSPRTPGRIEKNSQKSPGRSEASDLIDKNAIIMPKSPRKNDEPNSPKSPRKIEDKNSQRLFRKTEERNSAIINHKSPGKNELPITIEKSPRRHSSRISAKDDKESKARSLSSRRLRTRSEVEPVDPSLLRESHFTRTSTKEITKSPRAHPRSLSRITRLSIRTVDPIKERPEERTVLGAIKRILEQPWFHGDITKEDADSSLATAKMIEGPKIFGAYGDFLVRLSFSEPVEKHPYTITKVNKKGVIFHQRIFYNEDVRTYVVLTKTEQYPQVSADSLISLIKQLLDLKIVAQPCKRWNYARKYADIFEKKLSQDGGYVDTTDTDTKDLKELI